MIERISEHPIAAENWTGFDAILGFGPIGKGKEKLLAWLDFVNEKRKLVAHPSSLAVMPVVDLMAFSLSMYRERQNPSQLFLKKSCTSQLSPLHSKNENALIG